jgi:zinc and cadmium transporter
MTSNLLVAGYCVVIVGASLVGGRLPAMFRFSHSRMQLVLSLVGGLMLSVSLFVLFSHATHELGSADLAAWWTMIGMLAMFFLIRTFHFHQHGSAEVSTDANCQMESHGHESTGSGRHDAHEHGHVHQHGDMHSPATDGRHALSFVGIALGLGLHTLIDGIALAASVQAEVLDDHPLALAGFGTFLAIVLHKPLDALSITSVMAAGGWSRRAQSLANMSFSLMCPLGAALLLGSIDWLITDQQATVGRALGFSAGAFLCISLGDLLPEVQFHTHDRLKLSAMLLLGVALGYGVSRLDPPHDEAHHHEAKGNAGHGD